MILDKEARALIWSFHADGWPVSRIARETGFDDTAVRRSIAIRWALDKSGGDDLGRDIDKDGRTGISKGNAGG